MEGTYPYAVQLSYTNDKKTEKIALQKTNITSYRYTTCVPTMHDYTSHNQLVDFIETNRLFGANHFTIYNTTSSGMVDKYLSYYIKKKIVTIIQWNLPIPQEDIHYFGQLASIGDCLYRNIYQSKYIAFMDLDEVIVPRKGSNWDQILSMTGKPWFRQKGGYKVRCNFHQLCDDSTSITSQLPSDLKIKAVGLGINSVLLRSADRVILPSNHRAKVIVDSRAVTMMGIHNIWQYQSGFGDVDVHPSVGLLHHYRRAGGCSTDGQLDTYMERFAQDIVKNVEYVHDQVRLGL